MNEELEKLIKQHYPNLEEMSHQEQIRAVQECMKMLPPDDEFALFLTF